MSQRTRAICRVPGSTSNCGSGFDSLGLALSLYNEILVEREDAADTAERGFGEDLFPTSEMARETAARFFQAAGIKPFAVKIRIRGEVPQARGLGSSVTVRGGILGGLSWLSGADWSKEMMVDLLTELEGHPDNASASLLGGFTVSRFLDSPAKVESVTQIEIGEDLRFVVAAPEFEVLTSASRAVLPSSLSFADAIKSINSASCMVAALASGQYEALSGCGGDRVHEPYRLASIPGAEAAIAAGVEAGAYTGWLSGSGSSVLCVCQKQEASAVTDAMAAAFAQKGMKSVSYNLSADNEGLKLALSE